VGGKNPEKRRPCSGDKVESTEIRYEGEEKEGGRTPSTVTSEMNKRKNKKKSDLQNWLSVVDGVSDCGSSMLERRKRVIEDRGPSSMKLTRRGGQKKGRSVTVCVTVL